MNALPDPSPERASEVFVLFHGADGDVEEDDGDREGDQHAHAPGQEIRFESAQKSPEPAMRPEREQELPRDQQSEIQDVARQGDRVGASGAPHRLGTRRGRPAHRGQNAGEAERNEKAARKREEKGLHARVRGAQEHEGLRVMHRRLAGQLQNDAGAGHAPRLPEVQGEVDEEELDQHHPRERTVLEPPEITPRFPDARPRAAKVTHVPAPRVPG